ncbi:hypothetical protein ENH_00065580 [Eimeria necatrix]|uniref:Uncharacterized protein n=1 Tax=Eimeria necatrix TaxID=51315 RepID=U6N241_9EIME|nr:hypothetical protein ENH_00065580 [Eimeria necatrix]CDJ68829.1 hypothetical protein ENH_00065580 [Eimeria necatrix]
MCSVKHIKCCTSQYFSFYPLESTGGRARKIRKASGLFTPFGELWKKNNIWRYSMVSTSRSSEQADSLNTSNGGGSSSGCLDLTIRAFETRPLDRPVRDFSGCAVKGICTSEIRLVTTKAIHGMTCEIDPRFRHYSIGTRPILKAPSGALCRHCIAPQLLPEVWEAHLRSGVSAARDQQKKLTETCVIAHIENRPAAKRAALLDSLGRLGVPLWVNGKPLTHPAVVATDGESVALPMTGVKEEGAKSADVHMNSQQDHVLHRLSLLSLDTAEERHHQQQQFHLFSDVTEQQQKHHPKQQQHQAKTSRANRQQQKRGQVARTTQQQHAQQPQVLPSQPASASAYQGQADESVLVPAAAVANVAPVPQAEPISTPVNAVTSVVGRPSHCQRQRLKERLQQQQQDQLLLLSSPSAKEERLFHLQQQQQQQAHGSENDLLRLAQEVWMDARPMQQQHQQLHQLQQLQQLQEMQQIQQQELQHRQHRSVPVELAPLAVGVGSIAPFPTTAGWQQVQHHQRPAFTEATPPGLGLVTGDIQQQQQPPQLRVYGEADCPLPVVASSPLLPDVKGCSPLSQQEQLQKLWTPSSFTETVVQRQADTNLLWGHELTPNVSQQQRQQNQQNAVTLHQQFQRQQGELQQDIYQQSAQRIAGQQQQQGTRLRLAASNSMGLGFQPLLNWEEQQQQQSILMPGADQQQTVPQRQQQQQQQQQEQQQKQPALFLPAVSPDDFLTAGEQQQQGIMQLQRMQWLAIPN